MEPLNAFLKLYNKRRSIAAESYDTNSKARQAMAFSKPAFLSRKSLRAFSNSQNRAIPQNISSINFTTVESLEPFQHHPDTKNCTFTMTTTTTETKESKDLKSEEQISFPDPPEYEIVIGEEEEKEEEQLPLYSLEDVTSEHGQGIQTPPTYTLHIHTTKIKTISSESLHELKHFDWKDDSTAPNIPRRRIKRCRDALKRTLTPTRRIISNSHSEFRKIEDSSWEDASDSETESLLSLLRDDIEATRSKLIGEKSDDNNNNDDVVNDNNEPPKSRLKTLLTTFTKNNTSQNDDGTTSKSRRRYRVCKKWFNEAWKKTVAFSNRHPLICILAVLGLFVVLCLAI